MHTTGSPQRLRSLLSMPGRLVAATGLALLIGSCAGSPDSSSSDAPQPAAVAPEIVVERERLVYLSAGLDAAQLAELAAVAPNVTIRSGLSRAEALELAHMAHGVDAHLCSPEFLSAATELRWVQAWSAGVDRYVGIEGMAENPAVVLTNMRGVHGPAIAEHVFATLLSLTRDLTQWRDAQRAGLWDRDLAPEMTTLAGRTMLVVGMGGIGREIALRAEAFDMQVLATVRTARQAPAFVDELGTAADLERFLPRADVVAIALPLTPETEGLFDAQRLALCKPGAYLVNIARGRIVDTDALLAALESGALAGACLDVTDPEPLNEGHPLWAREDVVITPHVASQAEITGDRHWSTFKLQMERFGRGEPLDNIVDFAIGY